MKKILALLILSANLFLWSINTTYAKEFYQNKYGVAFTKEEYNFISKFYFKGYQDYMTIDDYNNFITSNIMNGELKIKESTPNYIIPYAEIEHTTNSKTIKLSASCMDSICYVSVLLTWKSAPKVRSHDLIGSYFSNTNMILKNNNKMNIDGNYIYPINQKENNNGISSTYKLPSSGSNIFVLDEFSVKKSGRITSSYQHAKKDITLNDSQNFTFSPNGLGGVFAFNYPVNQYYDGMLGVYLDL